MSKSSASDTAAPPAPGPTQGERIAKRLARAGLCSRRDAERWVEEGRVAVNGTVLTSPAVNVGPRDRVTVDGKALPADEPTRVWRYHKPAGLVTSARDELGRATVFDHLPEDMPRVISIGRLDLNTEGLLLLTNDGELARHMELPATGWPRRYRVRVHGHPDEVKLASLKDGIFVDGIEYGPIEAVLDREQGANAWLTMTLREGKNREIRRVLEHLGLTVNRLIRLAYGPFQLGKLERGAVEEVPRRALREQLPDFFPAAPQDAPASGKPAAKAAPLRFDRLPKAAAARTTGSKTAAAGRDDTTKARAPSRSRDTAPVEWARTAPDRAPPKRGPAAATAKAHGPNKAHGQKEHGQKEHGPKEPSRGRPQTAPNAPPTGDDAHAAARALARKMDRALGRDTADDEDDDARPSRKPVARKPTVNKSAANKPVAGKSAATTPARGGQAAKTGHPTKGGQADARKGPGNPKPRKPTGGRGRD